MRFYDKKRSTVVGTNSKLPKMTGGGGRQWETFPIFINDVKYMAFIDKRFGKNVYFIYNGRCYSAVAWEFDPNVTRHLYTRRDFKTISKQIKEDTINSKFSNTYHNYMWALLNNPKKSKDVVWENTLKNVWGGEIFKRRSHFINMLENPSEVQQRIINTYKNR